MFSTRKLLEHGLYAKFLWTFKFVRDLLEFETPLVTESIKYEQILLFQIYDVFYILIFGLFVSSLIFIIETLYTGLFVHVLYVCLKIFHIM